MSTELYFIFSIIAGCTLLLVGIQNVSGALLEIFEMPVYRMVRRVQPDDRSSFFKGIFFSMVSASSLISSTTLLNLVNAGLMRLSPAYLFLAGANLGPFLLLSIVIFLGLKVGLVFLTGSLLATALSRSMKGTWFHDLHRLFLGLGLICLAKHFMGDGIQIVSNLNQGALVYFTEGPFVLSVLSGLFFGALICSLLRSSLLSILLFMVIRDGAFVSFYLLLPAVIGVHAISFVQVKKMADRGNLYAKRLSYGQAMMSLIGLIAGLMGLVFIEHVPAGGSSVYIVLTFALLRLMSVFLFVLFLSPLNRFIHFLLPDRDYPDQFELSQLGRALDMIPAMALLQCSFHVNKLKDIVDRLFTLTEEYILEDRPPARVLAKIKDYERITDNIHNEIRSFTRMLMENPLSARQAIMLQNIVKVSDELEYIADYIDKLASYNTRYQQEVTSQSERDELINLFTGVKALYFDVCDNLPMAPVLESGHVTARAQSLKIQAESVRENSAYHLVHRENPAVVLLTYSDMIVCLRKIRGHVLKIFNITHAMSNHEG